MVAQSRTQPKQLSMHECAGEGNGNPLQYSCLENPRDRAAWWAAICGVAGSDTTEATQQRQLFKFFGDQRTRNQCFYPIMLYTHTCTHTNMLSAGRGAVKQSQSYPADGNLNSYNPFRKKFTVCSSCLTQSYYFLELR